MSPASRPTEEGATDGTGSSFLILGATVTDHDLAELALLSYADRSRIAARHSTMRVFRTSHARAILVERDTECVVAFTGTDDLDDVRADIRGGLVKHTVGRVHAGFLAYLLTIWGRIRSALIEIDKPVIFCGHSLGGAAACIAALDWVQSGLICDRLVTFGQPRVGNRTFAAGIDESGIDHIRYVCCADVVSRLPRFAIWPLPVAPYRHSGTLIYLGCDGQRRVNPSRWSIGWDRATGRIRGIIRAVFRGVTDHSMSGYLRRV